VNHGFNEIIIGNLENEEFLHTSDFLSECNHLPIFPCKIPVQKEQIQKGKQTQAIVEIYLMRPPTELIN